MKYLIVIFFIVFNLTATCQKSFQPKLLFTKQLNNDIIDFSIDNLGNIYLVSSLGQIRKLNNKGDSISTYNDVRRYGKLSSVDVSNPFKILLYYKDFSTIVILDRLLNNVNVIDLKKLEIYQPSAATISYDNNIWIYDDQNSRLKKVDDNGNVLLQSNDYRQALDNVPSSVSLFDRDGQLYMYDSTKGLYIFDYYGALKNNIQILHMHDLQIINKNIITAHNSTDLIIYQPATLQTNTYAFPNSGDYVKVFLTRKYLYGLTGDHKFNVFNIEFFKN